MNNSFDSLGLSSNVLTAVQAAGYEVPTEIQAKAIPHVLTGQDLVGIAQTGTGKTASFTLPMLTKLERGRARARMPRTLILEPTRELAAQVEQSMKAYDLNNRFTVALLIGGVSFDQQDAKLNRGADVLIATPGRLLDHFQRGKLLMTGVEIFVIDEADRMLDMGFIPDIEKICRLLPARRQTLFFSATMPPEIERLTSQFLKDPVRVQVDRRISAADTIVQQRVAALSEPKSKRARLRELIDQSEAINNAIIFCNRKRDVATLARSLEKHQYSVGALHGDMDQHARMATLEGFRNGEIKILVASDVAARGLDIPAVSHVFNYDIPTHAEDYVHRIGRTGRAGRSGCSYSLVSKSDQEYWSRIEKLIGQEIDWFEGVALENYTGTNAAEAGPRRRGSSSQRAKGRTPSAESTQPDGTDTGGGKQESNIGKPPREQTRGARHRPKSHAAEEGSENNMPARSGQQGFGSDADIPSFMTIQLR